MLLVAPSALVSEPRTYPPHAAGVWQTPCSHRQFAPRLSPDFAAYENAVTAIDTGFGARATYGVPENLRLVDDPVSGIRFLEVRYPKGSTSPSQIARSVGGAGFYSNAGLYGGENVACLTYQVRFPKGFDFRRGGKLPGIFAGSRPPSGGERPKENEGFTARLMWRQGGAGELYLYAPNMVPSSLRGGMRLGTGNWVFGTEKWTTVEIEVVLNNVGADNGLIHIWVDGEAVLFVREVRFRKDAGLSIGGLMFSTFFGGKSDRFAPIKTEWAHFSAFKLYASRIFDLDNALGQRDANK